MKRSQWAGLGALVMLGAITSATAQESKSSLQRVARIDKLDLNIPAKPLDEALTDLSRKSGLQIVMYAEYSQGVTSPAIKGNLTAEEALKLLLAHTNLRFEYLDPQTVAVLSQSTNATSSAADPSADQRRIQLAANNLSATGVPGNSDLPVANAESGDASSGYSDSDQSQRRSIDEVVVTGTSIHGVYPESSPLKIFSQEEIKATGAQTIEQFFDKLPVNFNSLRAGGASSTSNETNQQQFNGVDLRGLGAGTTLVLLNGRPLAPVSQGRTPDISIIPLTAVDRIEILTDGASAIYGSDAVGGVVNFVMKKDFDGAETNVGYGAANGGNHETHASQTLGTDWNSGNALLAVQYSDQTPLDASDRDFSSAAGKFTLLPEDIRKSLFISAGQNVTSSIKLSGDLLYSWRQATIDSVTSPQADSFSEERNTTTTNNIFVNIGADISLPHSLNLEFLTTYTNARTNFAGEIISGSDGGSSAFPLNDPSKSSGFDAMVKLDGRLTDLPAGSARFAVGAGYTKDEYDYLSGGQNADGTLFEQGNDLSRHITYGFGELFVPLAGEAQKLPALDRLEVTLAARYQHYSDFGSNTSPKYGLLWAPIHDLKIRGTYASSFRAPFLYQTDPVGTNGGVFPLSFFPSVADHFGLPTDDILVYALGNRPGVGPEKAKTKTLGFDFTPEALAGLKIAATYFDINYTDRIFSPDPNYIGLFDPSATPNLYTLNPSQAHLANVFSGVTNFINFTAVDLRDISALAAATSLLYDNRVVNLAKSQISGLDINLEYRGGGFVFGTDLSRIFHYRQQVSATDPVISILNTTAEPVGLRARGWAGANRGPWGGQLGVNYTGAYSNPTDPLNPTVASWTTLDLSLSFKSEAGSGFAHGLQCSLAVQNLLNRDPPFVGVGQGLGVLQPIGYDPTNANPLKRFIAFELSKRWK